MIDLLLGDIWAAIAAVLLLVASFFGFTSGRNKREAEKQRKRADQAEREVKFQKSDADIDQRIREAEGDNEARDHRLRNPNDFP